MTLPKIDPTTTKAWRELAAHYETLQHTTLKELFAKDSSRAETFSIQWQEFYVDYSKNNIDATTKKLLLDLAKEVQLDSAMKSYFGGEIINETEGRAVLHTALRAPSTANIQYISDSTSTSD